MIPSFSHFAEGKFSKILFHFLQCYISPDFLKDVTAARYLSCFITGAFCVLN